MSNATIRRLVDMVSKLEAARPRLPYVIRHSLPPTEDDLAQIEANGRAGQPVVLMPRGCASMDEWIKRYAPLGAELR